jgi:hypothetical protein
MLVLEVLQTYPTQWKSLISSLGAVDLADTIIITFDIYSGEPHLPTLVSFQILVKIQNIIVHRCIIDEGESTCIMSKTVWKKLGSPDIVPSTITLRSYDGQPSSPEGLFQNVPVELRGKKIFIDIEVIDAPIDYNILFGRNYMYAMNEMASFVFRMMMFPTTGKSSPLTKFHIMILTTPPKLITSCFLFSLVPMHIYSWIRPPEFSRTHPCWGNTMENHLSYTLHHTFVLYLLMERKLETPSLPLRLLLTSKSHPLNKIYIRISLRTLLHHLSMISSSPRGKS